MHLGRTVFGFRRIQLSVMTREAQAIQDLYDALMFAHSPEEARRSASALAQAVLGEEANQLGLQEAMRRTCRKLRPSADPREQQRFENEFIELAVAPTGASHTVAA
jgi:hypothetical protein